MNQREATNHYNEKCHGHGVLITAHVTSFSLSLPVGIPPTAPIVQWSGKGGNLQIGSLPFKHPGIFHWNHGVILT